MQRLICNPNVEFGLAVTSAIQSDARSGLRSAGARGVIVLSVAALAANLPAATSTSTGLPPQRAPTIPRSLPDEPTVVYPVVFFPPLPPVYGARIRDKQVETRLRVRGLRLTPPEGLADFAGDFLYPALSHRLHVQSLTRGLEQRLEDYRLRRSALVNELLNRCVALHDADDETRERELRRFAAVQTPPIAALEAEADELRRELTRSRLGFDLSWNTGRRWKLGSFPAERDWMNREAEFQVIRAAAFYEDGLIPAQRGLLREVAFELDSPARKARGEPVDWSEAEAMFFSPETARLRLPPDLPREVLERVAAFNAQKAALKEQLRAVVNEQEKTSPSERAAAYARLADEQWPQIVELDTLAERLRVDLSPRFVPTAPQKPPAIPMWLIDVIHDYNGDRDAYFRDMQRLINQALASIPRPPRGSDSDEQVRLEDEYRKRQREARQKVVELFQQDNAARFEALSKRHEAIRSALDAIARTMQDPKTGAPLNADMLLRQHTTAMEEFDTFGRASAIYSTYRSAMLQPGLSPEQRRLLFGYGVNGLAQPLPYGEILPRNGAKFPLPR
jgi:hypothetical protein